MKIVNIRRATLCAGLLAAFVSSQLVPASYALGRSDRERQDTPPNTNFSRDDDSGNSLTSHATYQPSAEAAKAWGFDKSNLTPDNRVLFGVLPNGMRYAIRKNGTPQDTAVMRLVFSVGSLAEKENQRGLAHFLEHMAFNGSTNVPEGEMIKILERFGLAFGADTNAYTNFDTTGYSLDLPNTETELVDTALFLLRETASEITLASDAVDRERGVILSEKRSRENFGLQSFTEQSRFLLPDTKLAERLPIGTTNVLENATSEEIREFYHDYYTPGRATLVIVGDVDVADMEQKIIAQFNDWQAKNGEQPTPDYGSVDYNRSGDEAIFTDPAIGETATFVAFRPYEKLSDTLANRRQALLRNIGYRIINRRIGRVLRAGNAPFLGVNIGSDDVFEITRQTSLAISARDGELEKAIPAAEAIVRAAVEHGFSQSELNEQIANYRTGFGNAVRAAETRNNARLAEIIVQASRNQNLVTSPQARLARFEAAAETLTPDMVLQAIRDDLSDLSDPLIYITAKTALPGGTKPIRQRYLASRAQPVAPPQEAVQVEFAYQNFGPAGTVVADGRIDDLDIRTIRFANNVRLNIKKTDFEDDRIRISLRVDGGDILNTKEKPNATTLTEIYASAGLGAHSVDDLLTILAGRSVSFSFGSGTDYFGGYVTTTPDNSLLQFQLLAAYLTDPGYRKEALDRYRQGFDNYFASLKATPGSALGSEIGAIISDNDPRFSLSTQSELEALDFAQLQSAIGEKLRTGSIEIGVVGQVDEEEIISQIAKTFGALPQRNANKDDISALAQRQFTQSRGQKIIYHDGEPNQAILQFYWPTTDDQNFKETIGLNLLAEVVQLRLTDILREELGATYSPSARSFTSSTFQDYGYFSIGSNIDYADRQKVALAIQNIVKGLQEQPVSNDELLRARKPLLERIRRRETSNNSWISIVDEAQTDLRTLERFRQLAKMVNTIDTQEIEALARQYLLPEPLIVETIHNDYNNRRLDNAGIAQRD